MDYASIKQMDPEIFEAIELERNRQRVNIELIASENFVSEAVLEAAGSCLTNKYAEGYPGKRYYGGCECVDVAESLAIERAKAIFGAEHANVQPHSGAQANAAVLYAALSPGDKILGMNLAHGGHLTHGAKITFSGKFFEAAGYGVNDEGYLDMDNVREEAKKHQPKLIIAGASAYSRAIDFKAFSEIAKEVGAYLMVDMAHIAGLVAGGVHQNPVPYADFVTSTTHKTLRGPRGGLILCKAEHAKAVDKAVFPGIQGGPLMHIIAAKAVAFKEALNPDFTVYAKQVIENAKVLADGLMAEGFNLLAGGTDNHLVLVDLRNMNISGKEMEKRLDEVHITCNKNSIPNDPASPNVTSGIRLGTAAMTSRGMTTEHMKKIANIIGRIAKDYPACVEDVKKEVAEMCATLTSRSL